MPAVHTRSNDISSCLVHAGSMTHHNEGHLTTYPHERHDIKPAIPRLFINKIICCFLSKRSCISCCNLSLKIDLFPFFNSVRISTISHSGKGLSATLVLIPEVCTLPFCFVIAVHGWGCRAQNNNSIVHFGKFYRSFPRMISRNGFTLVGCFMFLINYNKTKI